MAASEMERYFSSLDRMWTHLFHGLLLTTSYSRLSCIDLSGFVPSKSSMIVPLHSPPRRYTCYFVSSKTNSKWYVCFVIIRRIHVCSQINFLFSLAKGQLYTLLQLVPLLSLTPDNLDQKCIFDMVVSNLGNEFFLLLTYRKLRASSLMF